MRTPCPQELGLPGSLRPSGISVDEMRATRQSRACATAMGERDPPAPASGSRVGRGRTRISPDSPRARSTRRAPRSAHPSTPKFRRRPDSTPDPLDAPARSHHSSRGRDPLSGAAAAAPPQAFAEETLARNIVKHWEWTDVDPPRDLRDAFLLHTVRTRESQRSAASILDGYKNAVRVALADGFVTREEVQQLAALRHQWDITRADHERIMSELAEEEQDVRAHPAGQVLAASGGHA